MVTFIYIIKLFWTEISNMVSKFYREAWKMKLKSSKVCSEMPPARESHQSWAIYIKSEIIHQQICWWCGNHKVNKSFPNKEILTEQKNLKTGDKEAHNNGRACKKLKAVIQEAACRDIRGGETPEHQPTYVANDPDLQRLQKQEGPHYVWGHIFITSTKSQL